MISVYPLPILTDNYIWVARNDTDNSVLAVDPGVADALLDHLNTEGLHLRAVFVTHHHKDHTGGVRELRERFSMPVFGPAHKSLPMVTNPVSPGDTVDIPSIGAFEVLNLSGHTAEQIGYRCGQTLFCGDALFSAGCGRIFDGTMEDLYRSVERIAALPDDTNIFCTHEYTLANLQFAKHVEPDNAAIFNRETEATAQRHSNKPTLPTKLGSEKRFNPFLRSHQPTVVTNASQHTGASLQAGFATFSALRHWKDHFNA